MSRAAEKIREMYVSNLTLMQDLKISERDLKIIEITRKRKGICSANLAHKLDITVANASTTLRSLYGKGYLTRLEHAAESGGVEYTYYAVD